MQQIIMDKDQFKQKNETSAEQVFPDAGIINKVKELLVNQDFAVLNTQNQTTPYASLVAFVVNDAAKQIVFATLSYTRKYQLLIESNRVALLIDNRAQRQQEISQIEAVTAIGTARRVSTDEELTKFRKLLLKRHSYLKELVNSESCIFFCVDVKRYFYVTHIQEVYQWVPN